MECLNLDSVVQPSILFLHGCFISDIEQDIDEVEPLCEYERRHIIWTRSSWIKHTSYPCGRCNAKIIGSPKCLPLALSMTDGEYEFGIASNYYCSWACVDSAVGHNYTQEELVEKLKSMWD
jgi:hypothetical protein